MIERWYFEGNGLPAHHHAPGVGWGRIGTQPVNHQHKEILRGRQGVEYRVDGEWMTTRKISEDTRNILGLGRKAVQSRLDRLRKAGYSPETRGISSYRSFGPPNFILTWDVFQTHEPRELKSRLIRFSHPTKRERVVNIEARTRSPEVVRAAG